MNAKQRYAIECKNRKELRKINPDLDEFSGIYFLTREENGFKYAYIGQAKHILSRLSGHLMGYQAIDLSIKKHGFYKEDNPNGWKINFLHYPIEHLDALEQYWILQYANAGYQLRNKTSGSQGTGKAGLDNQKSPKGYRDGLAQGRKNLAREIYGIVDKHLVVSIQPDKSNNKISQRMYNKFWELLTTDKSEE